MERTVQALAVRLAALLVVVGVGLGLGVGVGVGRAGAESVRPVVLVFGDSLVWEAEQYLSSFLTVDHDVRVFAVGGTAICDYADDVVRRSAELHPRMVVLAFSGNSLTTCMLPPPGTPNDQRWIVTKYQRDLDGIVAPLGRMGVSVTLVGAPPRLERVGDAVERPTTWTIGAVPSNMVSVETNVNGVYESTAARARARGFDVGYVDGGRRLKSPSGGWTKVLPCSVIDPGSACVAGLVTVRAFDLVHFCPEVMVATEGVVQRCPVYSGGAVRYALAIDAYVRNRIETSADAVHGGSLSTDWTIDADGLTVPVVGEVGCFVVRD
jgi:hypothetical protein